MHSALVMFGGNTAGWASPGVGIQKRAEMPLLDEQERCRRKIARGMGEGGRSGWGMAPAPRQPEQKLQCPHLNLKEKM